MDDTLRRLGQHARQVLGDPATQEVLNMIEQQLTQSWKEAQESEVREEVWYTLQGHQRFVTTLKAFEDNYVYEQSLEEK